MKFNEKMKSIRMILKIINNNNFFCAECVKSLPNQKAHV